MRSRVIILCALAVLPFVLSGCGAPPATSPNTVSNSANNANNPLATKTPVTEQTTNNAPTLTPVFKAYCEAMVKKDEAALRKIYSAATIKVFEAQMKEDKIKTLIEFLETEIPEKICEVRNEQITGETALAEIRTDTYPKGLKVIFHRENGEWKLTNQSPGSITQTPANTAK